MLVNSRKFDMILQVKFAFIFAIFFVFSLFAQPTQFGEQRQTEPIGIVRGRVFDLASKQPMEYVSVSLRRSRDSSIIAGTLTNNDGTFELKNIAFGRYYLALKFVGFKTKIIDSIFLTPRSSTIMLGNIFIENDDIKTKEIEITAQKDIITYSIDKRIYNVDRDLSVVSGSAVDVLANVPSVNVDLDGNISLRGSGNVTILIDGKPSALLGFDRTSVLDNIPSDNIERIEVITNPSAKYDPEGVVGIINIVLKKNVLLGYGGMVQSNVGTLDKYNGSINLNVKTDGLNSNLGYSFRFFRMLGSTNLSRESFFPVTSFLDQLQNFSRRGRYHRLQLSTDWQIDNLNSLSGGFNFGNFNRKGFDSTGYLFRIPTDNFFDNYYRKTETDFSNTSCDIFLFFKRSFEQKGREFNANVIYTNFSGSGDEFYNQIQLLPENFWELIQNQNNKTANKRGNLLAEVNYSHPFNFGKLELGARTSFRKIDIDYAFFEFDTLTRIWQKNEQISNIFGHNENIFSAYSIFSGRIHQNFGFQVGLRFEGTNTKGNQETQNYSFSKNYYDWFPTIHLSYAISNLNTIMMSYTRRINRPSFFALNPFVNYSDPQNLSQGNPELSPEYANAIEISDLQFLPQGSLNFTLFYRYTTDIITRLTRLIDTNQTLTTYQNLNRSNNFGFEAIWSQNLFNWFKINLNFSYFYMDINGVPQFNIPARSSRSWNVKLNSVLNVHKNVTFQVNCIYESPVVTTGFGGMSFGGGPFFSIGTIGTRQGIYMLNISAKIDIISDKASINLRLMDVFKSIKYDVTTSGNNFKSRLLRTRESRVAFIGFQYKFNDYKPPKMPRPEEMPDME